MEEGAYFRGTGTATEGRAASPSTPPQNGRKEDCDSVSFQENGHLHPARCDAKSPMPQGGKFTWLGLRVTVIRSGSGLWSIRSLGGAPVPRCTANQRAHTEFQ